MQIDTNPLCNRFQPTAPYLLRMALFGLFLMCFAMTGLGRAEPNGEAEAAIQHLLDYVRQSDLVFVRNSDEHDSSEAAKHISEKYAHFRDEIATPEEFIQLCASKSLLTGKAYVVIDKQGREIATRDWLLTELAAYNTRNDQANQ